MKTTLDLVDIVYHRLKPGLLVSQITGGLYKKRPLNSLMEDVVVNSLPINNLQLQAAVINVNIHVPNLIINIAGQQDNTQPDYARLKALAALAKEELTDVWGDDYNFDIQQQQTIEEENLNETYLNIRLDFYSINILN